MFHVLTVLLEYLIDCSIRESQFLLLVFYLGVCVCVCGGGEVHVPVLCIICMEFVAI